MTTLNHVMNDEKFFDDLNNIDYLNVGDDTLNNFLFDHQGNLSPFVLTEDDNLFSQSSCRVSSRSRNHSFHSETNPLPTSSGFFVQVGSTPSKKKRLNSLTSSPSSSRPSHEEKKTKIASAPSSQDEKKIKTARVRTRKKKCENFYGISEATRHTKTQGAVEYYKSKVKFRGIEYYIGTSKTKLEAVLAADAGYLLVGEWEKSNFKRALISLAKEDCFNGSLFKYVECLSRACLKILKEKLQATLHIDASGCVHTRVDRTGQVVTRVAKARKLWYNALRSKWQCAHCNLDEVALTESELLEKKRNSIGFAIDGQDLSERGNLVVHQSTCGRRKEIEKDTAPILNVFRLVRDILRTKDLESEKDNSSSSLPEEKEYFNFERLRKFRSELSAQSELFRCVRDKSIIQDENQEMMEAESKQDNTYSLKNNEKVENHQNGNGKSKKMKSIPRDGFILVPRNSQCDPRARSSSVQSQDLGLNGYATSPREVANARIVQNLSRVRSMSLPLEYEQSQIDSFTTVNASVNNFINPSTLNKSDSQQIDNLCAHAPWLPHVCRSPQINLPDYEKTLKRSREVSVIDTSEGGKTVRGGSLHLHKRRRSNLSNDFKEKRIDALLKTAALRNRIFVLGRTADFRKLEYPFCVMPEKEISALSKTLVCLAHSMLPSYVAEAYKLGSATAEERDLLESKLTGMVKKVSIDENGKLEGKKDFVGTLEIAMAAMMLQVQQVVNRVYKLVAPGNMIIEDGILGHCALRHIRNLLSLWREHSAFLSLHRNELPGLDLAIRASQHLERHALNRCMHATETLGLVPA
eukprot:g2240.t1